MADGEEQIACGCFCCNWVMIGLMAVALVAGFSLTGFSIAPESTLSPIAITGVYLGYAYHKRYRAQRRDPKVVFVLGSTGQTLMISVLYASRPT